MTEPYPKENIVIYEAVPSTNEKAKELALKDGKPWTVVHALKQESGHGRKGERWFSPVGGLYFTVILPKSDIHNLQTLTMLAAFIVAGVIKDNFNLEPMMKLPNDVFVNGKKVCGILTENVIGGEVKIVGHGHRGKYEYRRISGRLKEYSNIHKNGIRKRSR